MNHDHTPESAEKVVAGIQAAGGSAMAVAADVSSRAEYQTVVEQVLASWGRWDVLVNNAAVASQAANRESKPKSAEAVGRHHSAWRPRSHFQLFILIVPNCPGVGQRRRVVLWRPAPST